MRFPFTFMGLFSIALGAWIGGYVALRPAGDPLTATLELGPGIAMLAFGAYLVYRRLKHGIGA